MKWTISLPRVVAEDDAAIATVEADSIEEAIKIAAPILHGRPCSPPIGQVYCISARVEVARQPALPLKSV